MRARIVTVTLLGLTVMAACGGGQDANTARDAAFASQKAEYEATAGQESVDLNTVRLTATEYPHPDAAQEAELVRRVLEVDSSLIPEKIEQWSRSTCMSLWDGSPDSNMITATTMRFTDEFGQGVDRADAERILVIVKDVFCHE